MKHEDSTDRKLDLLLQDAAATYRVPPEPSFDLIWSRVEQEAFARSAVHGTRGRMGMLVAAVAASLLLGVMLGRYSARATAPPAVATTGRDAGNTNARAAAAPYQRETEEFLGNTAVLLAALPRDGSTEHAPTLLPQQAARLLTKTRLLLDSPAAGDARMRDLLQDLELVLAQVARLQPRRQNAELTMISQTLQTRDLVPRIRSAVTDLNFSDYPE